MGHRQKCRDPLQLQITLDKQTRRMSIKSIASRLGRNFTAIAALMMVIALAKSASAQTIKRSMLDCVLQGPASVTGIEERTIVKTLGRFVVPMVALMSSATGIVHVSPPLTQWTNHPNDYRWLMFTAKGDGSSLFGYRQN
jgi:hypothetical protein